MPVRNLLDNFMIPLSKTRDLGSIVKNVVTNADVLQSIVCEVKGIVSVTDLIRYKVKTIKTADEIERTPFLMNMLDEEVKIEFFGSKEPRVALVIDRDCEQGKTLSPEFHEILKRSGDGLIISCILCLIIKKAQKDGDPFYVKHGGKVGMVKDAALISGRVITDQTTVNPLIIIKGSKSKPKTLLPIKVRNGEYLHNWVQLTVEQEDAATFLYLDATAMQFGMMKENMMVTWTGDLIPASPKGFDRHFYIPTYRFKDGLVIEKIVANRLDSYDLYRSDSNIFRKDINDGCEKLLA